MQKRQIKFRGLRECVNTLFIYKRTIVSLALLCGVGAAVVAFVQPKVYEASVQMWVQNENNALRGSTNYAADSAARVRMILSNVREVIYSRQVLEETLKKVESKPADQSDLATPNRNKTEQDDQFSRLSKAICLEGQGGSDFGSSQIFHVRIREQDPALARSLLIALLESFRGRYKHLNAEQAMHLYDETSAATERARDQLARATESFHTFVHEIQGGMSELNSMSGASGSESEFRRQLDAINGQLVPSETELTVQVAFLDEMQKAGTDGGKQLMVPGSFIRDYPALEVAARELGNARIQMDNVAARETPESPQYQEKQERLRLAEQNVRHEIDQGMDAVRREIAAKTEAVEFLKTQRDMCLEKLATLANKFLQYDGLKQEVAQCRGNVADTEKRRGAAMQSMLSAAEETEFATMDGPRAGTDPIGLKPALTIVLGLLIGLISGSVLSLIMRRLSQVVHSDADLAGMDDGLMIVSVPKVLTPLQKAS